MGGYGSGRSGGRPTAEASCRIDITWMLRQGLACVGERRTGTLCWTSRGQPSGSIGYQAWMDVAGYERLELDYTRSSWGEESEKVRQVIHLCHTQPHFGGKRWWMICPYRGIRVGKLYLPPGGDRFASRQAWRLGYYSQRITARDKPFEALFRLQKKLGCEQGWGNIIHRPKGMWHRTFERHWEEFLDLDDRCAVEMAPFFLRLGRQSH